MLICRQPSWRVEPFFEVRRLIDFHAPILEQAVLADLMAEGHFTRHLGRMRTLYPARRTALLEALRELPLEVRAAPAGSYCIGWLPRHIDEAALVSQAVACELNLWLVSQCSIEPLPRQGLILGHGNHSPEEIQEAVWRLGTAMQAVKDLISKPSKSGLSERLSGRHQNAEVVT